MSEAKWTEEQLKAITHKGSDILVAAAAGSGKTAVLVERIIRTILAKDNPVDIDKLLVLTFTNAAAAQMRERIRLAIEKLTQEDPTNLHLARQLVLLNRSSITTIDSFCLALVRENYIHVNIDPGFRIADSKELDLMKHQILEELFEEKYTENYDDSFFELVECFGEDTGDKALRNLILEIFEFVQSNPFPNQWFELAARNFNEENNKSFSDTKWGKIIIENSLSRVNALIMKTETAINLSQQMGGLSSYLTSLGEDLSFLEKLKSEVEYSYDNTKELLDFFKFPALGRKKKDDDETKVNRVKDLRESVKKGIENLKEDFYFSSETEMMERHIKIYPIIKSLIKLVKDFSDLYLQFKKEKLVFYFNDIAHFALEILLEEGSTIEKPIPSLIAKNIRERYYEVLTDEYQDSNMVQEMLLYAVSGSECGNNNRFMVGDVKQSIYSFRQADPSIFMEKFKTYKNDGKEVRIDLSRNFRSRKNILDSINLIFCQLMSPALGDIEYDDKSELNPGAIFPEFIEENHQRAIELNIINRKDLVEDEDDSDEELDAAELEMSFVAKRITEMLDTGFKVYDNKEGYRNLKLKDIVILFRSLPKWASAAGKVLSEAGIPTLAPTQSSYFDNTEILFILNLLKLIDNFRQDIPIMAVLKSPVYDVNDDELLQIKLSSQKSEFYDCLINIIENNERNELKEKLIKFTDDINRWKRISSYTPVSQLLWIIYNETGYYDYLSVKRLGKRRQANLKLLIQKAEMLEKSNFKGLFNFLRYVEKLSEVSADDSEAVTLDESQDLVRIMTIHKSKGLEFPVVFVCGLGKTFNTMDLKQKVLMHHKNGIGMEYIDYEGRVRYNTVSRSVLKEIKKSEMLSEEMRVLYVALTRAKEKLILTSTLRDLEKSALKWCNNVDNKELILSIYDMKKATSYIDWIAPSLVRHRDGNEILDYAGIIPIVGPKAVYNHDSQWKINLLQKNEIINWRKNNEPLVCDKQFQLQEENIELKTIVLDYLNFKYPYSNLAMLPANISVSEIKRHRAEENTEEEFMELFPEKPQFKRPELKSNKVSNVNLTSSQKGVAIHTVMENLRLDITYTFEEIEKKIKELSIKQILTEQEAESVNISKIINFFESELGDKLHRADRIYKEESFAMELTPYEIYGKDEYIGVEEGILIHGIIDCFFIKDEKVILFDYKTDYVNDSTGIELIKKYSVQLEVYKKAIEKIIGKKVDKCYIYSFYLDKVLEL